VTDFTLPIPASQLTLNPSAHHPVIVIGAGLAGLTATLLLAERGLQPLLLEAASGCSSFSQRRWPGIRRPAAA
jgi:glycine/D-amino acid oxidase-like deaminating enzyme